MQATNGVAVIDGLQSVTPCQRSANHVIWPDPGQTVAEPFMMGKAYQCRLDYR